MMANLPFMGVRSDGDFSYQPLTEDDSIRLIQIQPSPLESADVHCNIIYTTLSQCEHEILEHYTALSYVWGDPTDLRTIWVDDSPVSITASLYSALRDLRDAARVSRLWADALCIDQSNNEEKGEQIAKMGRIYATADHTVIYLGPGGPQLRFLREASMSDKKACSIPKMNATNARDLVEFVLSNPWFTRVWVFQELVFSRQPFVQFGKSRWSWKHLYKFLHEQKSVLLLPEFTSGMGAQALKPRSGAQLGGGVVRGYEILDGMQTARNGHLLSRVLQEVDDFVTHKAELDGKICAGKDKEAHDNEEVDGRELTRSVSRHHHLHGRKFDDKTTESSTLLSLLSARRGLGASDARDILFAHLGFAADGEHFTADYTKTCTQVYEDVADYLLESSETFEVLSFVGEGSPTRPEGLPSWVPDWSSPKTISAFPFDCLNRVGFENNRVKMKLGHDLFFNLAPSPSVLACAGNVIDTVVRFSKRLSGLDISSDRLASLSSQIEVFRSKYATSSESDEENFDESVSRIFSDIYKAWRELVDDDELMPDIDFSDDDEDIFPAISYALGRPEDTFQYGRYMYGPLDYLAAYFFMPGFDKNLVDGRCLALLASRRRALVPANVQMGDIVVILCPTRSTSGPYISRQRHDLRNPAYSSVLKENFVSTMNYEYPLSSGVQNMRDDSLTEEATGGGASSSGESVFSENIEADINFDDFIVPCTFIGDSVIENQYLLGYAGDETADKDSARIRIIAFH